MSTYTEANLPLHLKDGELLNLDDGAVVRWESNGEAKALFVGDAFLATAEIFPGCDQTLEIGGHSYKCTASFENDLLVEKLS